MNTVQCFESIPPVDSFRKRHYVLLNLWLYALSGVKRCGYMHYRVSNGIRALLANICLCLLGKVALTGYHTLCCYHVCLVPGNICRI